MHVFCEKCLSLQPDLRGVDFQFSKSFIKAGWRQAKKEGWQSDRSRWTRNPVYSFRVSGVWIPHLPHKIEIPRDSARASCPHPWPCHGQITWKQVFVIPLGFARASRPHPWPCHGQITWKQVFVIPLGFAIFYFKNIFFCATGRFFEKNI